MTRFGRRFGREVRQRLRAALSLWLIAMLGGAPACSQETPAPTPANPEAVAEEPLAAEPAPEIPPADGPEAVEAEGDDEEVRVASADIKGLVAPIALYPDPLLELVLQAAAQPGQVVLASRFLDDHAQDPSLQPDERWDTAVIGLLNHPDVLDMMNEYLDWTTELGQTVADDLEGVQLAVQELRWSAYNLGTLQSNEWQDVLIVEEFLAIVPAQPDQLAVPQYDGAALLAAAAPANAASFAPTGGAGNVVASGAAVPVTFGTPQPSFWSTTAVFLGGAALGGLLGYAIGRNDNDRRYYFSPWGWHDPWDRRPWSGNYWRNNRWYGPTTIIRPARPIVVVRPNRPIYRPDPWRPGRPGGGGRPEWNRPEIGDGGSLGRPNRPQRPGIDRPGTGRPDSGRPGIDRPGSGRPGGSRPEVTRPGQRPGGATRPGRGDEGQPIARPARPRPPGVAPARPAERPSRPDRDVNLPRPGTRPIATRPGDRPSARPADRPVTRPAERPSARPADRPAARPTPLPADRPTARPTPRPADRPTARPAPRPGEQRPAARPGGRPAERPASRPATRETRPPSRDGALAQRNSPPRVQRERVRGQESRQSQQRTQQQRSPQQRSQQQRQPQRQQAQQRQSQQRPAMQSGRDGGRQQQARDAQRGRESRRR